MIGDPKVLLCDEPLLSLDLSHQQEVSELIDARRREAGSAVVFVTHEINPILPYVDRVLYLVGGRWAVGTPDEVLTSEGLSELYGTEIDVLNVRGRIIVVGSDETRADRARRSSPSSPRPPCIITGPDRIDGDGPLPAPAVRAARADRGRARRGRRAG